MTPRVPKAVGPKLLGVIPTLPDSVVEGALIVANPDRFCIFSPHRGPSEGANMAESVYKIVELVGSSTESWEKAARAAVEQASKSLRDLRIAEIKQLDMHLEDGKVLAYRARVQLSFKFERE